ncbi:hypothetical protein LXL04_024970 [Taraxacum kok-saghyz]
MSLRSSHLAPAHRRKWFAIANYLFEYAHRRLKSILGKNSESAQIRCLDAEIAAIKEDVSDLKKEVLELKKKKRGHRVHISCNLL